MDDGEWLVRILTGCGSIAIPCSSLEEAEDYRRQANDNGWQVSVEWIKRN